MSKKKGKRIISDEKFYRVKDGLSPIYLDHDKMIFYWYSAKDDKHYKRHANEMFGDE